MEIVRSTLGQGGGLKDGALVSFKDLQPGGDIAGMIRALVEAYAEIGAQ